ncbi:MAG: hypothetical protein CMF19_07560 [Idiomarinaceae bacterium]|nr:hypothetical protein [Idiomarinaceae bacterium]
MGDSGLALGAALKKSAELNEWKTKRFENVFLGKSACYLNVKPNVNKLYIRYVLESSHFQNYIHSLATGSTIKNVSLKLIRDYTFKLPPANVQEKVSNTLASLDAQIDINRQINQTLEQIAQAIFKSWFVDFEPVKAKISALAAGGSKEDALFAAMQAISGKDKAQLSQLQTEKPDHYHQLRTTAELFPSTKEDSELGEIPEGWSCLALDEIAKYQNGLALQKFRPTDDEDWLPVVKIAQLKKGFADGQERATANIKPDCIIENGDVVFSWSGSLMIDTWCGGRAALNQHLFKVTSKDYPKWLFFHFTRHHLEEFQRIAADKAVTMGHIKREHLKQALCAIPDTKLLDATGITLSTMLEKQITLRLESDSLKQLRDSLLPKLLSGDVSLDPDTQCDKSSPDHLEEPDLNALISEIEKDLPPKDHFVVHESSREQREKLGMIGYSTKITGALAEGGAEYFKLPAFLRELRNNKALEKLFAATVEGISGVPFLMDGATAILNKFLGKKIKFEQRTALVLLAFPKELTRETQELLEKARQLCVNAGLPPIDETQLLDDLNQLRDHGLVIPLGQKLEEWRLVEKFYHEIDNWS